MMQATVLLSFFRLNTTATADGDFVTSGDTAGIDAMQLPSCTHDQSEDRMGCTMDRRVTYPIPLFVR